METKTAKQLLADMDALQTRLRLTICKCCGKRLDMFTQELHPKSTRTPSTYGTCRTAGCERESVTRELVDLYTLSQDVIDSFKQSA